jgi:hypothetical protein
MEMHRHARANPAPAACAAPAGRIRISDDHSSHAFVSPEPWQSRFANWDLGFGIWAFFPYLPALMREWLRIASSPSVVKRALGYAIVVGIILIAINHGDAILKGDISHTRALKMALTILVPYVVSTLSSVGALRERNRAGPQNS